jgi:hypothetical protein
MQRRPRRKGYLNRALLSTAFNRGIWLPFRLYFQPRRVMDEGGRPSSFDSAGYQIQIWLTYLFSLLWLPAGMLVAWALSGIAEPSLWNFLFYPVCLIGLGTGLGVLWLYQQGQVVGTMFDFPIATALSVVLGLATAVAALVSQRLGEPSLALASLGDADMIYLPVKLILCLGVGIGIAIVLGTRTALRTTLLLGFAFGTIFSILMALVSTPGAQIANAMLFVVPTLFITHLIFQPIYFAVGAISRMLLRLNPKWALRLWPICPANWCEFSYVPLIGLRELLMQVYRTDPTVGLRAINRVKHHPFYKHIGEQVSKQLYTPGQLNAKGTA